MTAPADIPLEILGDATPDPWGIRAVEPTLLVAPIGHGVPLAETDADRVASRLIEAEPGLLVELMPDQEDERGTWVRVVRTVGIADADEDAGTPATEDELVFSLQDADAVPPEAMPPSLRHLASAPMVLVVETTLDRADPLASFARAMRRIATAFPAVEAVHDVATLQWFDADELHRLFVEERPAAPPSTLWRISLTAPSPQPGPHEPMWLLTQGLARCGLPELELVELPASLMQGASALVNACAELWLDEGMPGPANVTEIGPDARIRAMPWREVAPSIAEEALGRPEHRASLDGSEHGPLSGVRAILCDEHDAGRFRQVPVPPTTLVERFQGDGLAVYRTGRAAERTERATRQRWEEFLDALDSLATLEQPPVALVRAAVSSDAEGESDASYDWFTVRSREGERVRATREIGAPDDATPRMFGRGDVREWRLAGAGGALAPEHPRSITAFLDGWNARVARGGA